MPPGDPPPHGNTESPAERSDQKTRGRQIRQTPPTQGAFVRDGQGERAIGANVRICSESFLIFLNCVLLDQGEDQRV